MYDLEKKYINKEAARTRAELILKDPKDNGLEVLRSRLKQLSQLKNANESEVQSLIGKKSKWAHSI